MENFSPPLRSVATIILAAGASRRLGRPKQLETFQGKTLLRHSIETALAVECGPIQVVLGENAALIVPTLAGLPVRLVENADWAEGMASSLRCGISSLAADCEAALILLCDQPLVTADDLKRLLAAFHEGNAPLAASTHGGVAGVPALFDRSHFPELLALRGDLGARPVIQRHLAKAALVPLPGAAFDIDTESDIQNLQRSAKSL